MISQNGFRMISVAFHLGGYRREFFWFFLGEGLMSHAGQSFLGGGEENLNWVGVTITWDCSVSS